MYPRLKLRALLCALGLASWFPAIAHPGETYVFGQSIVIDTGRNLAMYGPYFSQVLDCSTPRLLCMHTTFLEIAVPRSCAPLRVGDTIPAYRSNFEVIGQVLSLSRAGPNSPRIFLLGDRERPSVVVGYDPLRGVRMIVRNDATPPRDYLAELKAAQAEGRLQQAFDALERNRFPLITFAPLFRCGSGLQAPGAAQQPPSP
jgi:hypothetical protein